MAEFEGCVWFRISQEGKEPSVVRMCEGESLSVIYKFRFEHNLGAESGEVRIFRDNREVGIVQKDGVWDYSNEVLIEYISEDEFHEMMTRTESWEELW